MEKSLAPMVAKEPRVAARLLVQALPAAAKPIRRRLAYALVISDVGSYEVTIEDGHATVMDVDEDGARAGDVDFELRTDARTFAGLAIGESPIKAILSRRLRVKGKLWRAVELRKLEKAVSLRDVVDAGADPDLLYRAMRYAIEPEWEGRKEGRPR
jgi:SCP-2 sterol transfer family